MKSFSPPIKYFVRYVLTLTLSFLSLVFFAQDMSIEVVKQYNGKPVSGIVVTVTQKDNPQTTYDETTNIYGVAKFSSLIDGKDYIVDIKEYNNGIVLFDAFNNQFTRKLADPLLLCQLTSKGVHVINPDKDIEFDKTNGAIVKCISSIVAEYPLIYIPPVFNGFNVKSIAPGAFKGMGIQNIELPDGLDIIGEIAFASNKFNGMKLPAPAAAFNKWSSSKGVIILPGTFVTDLSSEYKAIYDESSVAPNPDQAPAGMEYFNSKNGFPDDITGIAFLGGTSQFGFFTTSEYLYRYTILSNKIQANPVRTDIPGGGKTIAVNPANDNLIVVNPEGKPALFADASTLLTNKGVPANYPNGNFSASASVYNNTYYLCSDVGNGVAVFDGSSWSNIIYKDNVYDAVYDANASKMLFSLDDYLLYSDYIKLDNEYTRGIKNMCYANVQKHLWLHDKYKNVIYIYSVSTNTLDAKLTEKCNSVIPEIGQIVDIKYKVGAWGNKVCIAGEKGIAVLNNYQEWKVYTAGFRASITCIEIIDNGTIWVGTKGAGMVAIYPEVKGEVTATNTPGSLQVKFDANFASITTEAKYYFNFDDGNGKSVYSPNGGAVTYTHTYEKPGTYKVFVTAESAIGETGNASLYVTVTAEATPCAFANFTISQLGGGTISLTNTSQVNGTPKYKWDMGDGTGYDSVNISNHTYKDNGFYTIYLGAYNADKDCYSETKREIEIKDALGENTVIRASFSSIIKGDTVDFINSSTGDIGGYYWDFGDGYTSEMRSPRHIYKEAGVYDVRLVAYNDKTGQADKIYNTIEIKDQEQRCYISFTYMETPKTILTKVYLNVMFAAKYVGNAEEFFWDFGDGTYYTGNDTIVHTYKEPGTYEVVLQAKSSDKVNITSCNKYVMKVVVNPTKDLIGYKDYCTAKFSYYIKENTVKLANESTTSANIELKYIWDFGDGSYAYTKDATHTYSKPGVYYIKLTASGITLSGQKMINTYTIPVRISATYIPVYKADFSFYTEGNIVYFSSTSEGEISKYFWDFGDGRGYSYESTAKYEYKSAGYYKVLLRIYDEKTGKIDEVAKEVVVSFGDDICKADFSYFADSNGMVSFFTQSIGNFDSYSWDFDDGLISNEENPVHTYKKSGYYVVALTVKSKTLTYMHAVKKRVYIKPFTSQTDTVIPVDADFASNASTDTNAVQFEDRSLGDVLAWYWDFGDNSRPSTEQNPEHVYTTSGYYNVCLTVKNEKYQNTDCQILSVGDVTGKHSSYFTYFADKESNIVHFNNQSAGDIDSYFWDFGDGVTSVEEVPSHTYSQKGYYAVCLTTTPTVESVTSAPKRYCQDINISEENIDTCTYNCVWPGDANNDNEANHYDILTIGMNYGMEGPSRLDASILWKGQTSQLWANYQIDSTNNMHGDCNGDGIINLDDTLAIRQNFAHSHTPNKEEFNKAGEWTLTAEISEIVPTKGAATTRVVRTILTEPSDKSVNEIYGFGYELELVGVEGVNWSGIIVDFNGNFLTQTANDLITFFTVDQGNSKIYISLSKNDQANVTSAGAVATVYLPFPSGGGESIEVIITSDGGIKASGEEITIKGGTVSASSDAQKLKSSNISIYPNPNNGSFYISSVIADDDEIQIDIIDITGKIIFSDTRTISAGLVNEFIELNSIMPGIYTAKVLINGNSTIERFVIK